MVGRSSVSSQLRSFQPRPHPLPAHSLQAQRAHPAHVRPAQSAILPPVDAAPAVAAQSARPGVSKPAGPEADDRVKSYGQLLENSFFSEAGSGAPSHGMPGTQASAVNLTTDVEVLGPHSSGMQGLSLLY